MLDYWKLTNDYHQGDFVQRINYVVGSVSPFVGHVTAVHRGIGYLDVQWPYGNERMSPEDLVKCNPAIMLHLPPSLDQSYSAYDIDKARRTAARNSKWAHVNPTFYIDMARHWAQHHAKSTPDVGTYDVMYHRYASTLSDEQMREAVKNFYRLSHNLYDLRLTQGVRKVQSAATHKAQQHKVPFKTAAYWYSRNRTHRATPAEVTAGRPNCPKCSTCMKATTYRMTEQEGQKVVHRIFACPKCLYLLDPASIIGPTGEPHDWFGTANV